MIEVESRDGNLIFKDYLNREISILQEDYLELLRSPERQMVRPALESCFLEPSEVWWVVEDIEGQSYSYYKYLKVYNNLVFVALVMHTDTMENVLNNFYGYGEDQFELAELERKGQLIKSNLR